MTATTDAPERQVGSATPAGWPAVVDEVELSLPLRPIKGRSSLGVPCDSAWLLVRIFDEPVGLITVPLREGYADVACIAGAVRAECGEAVASRVRAAGGDPDAAMHGRGTTTSRMPAFLTAQETWRTDGPAMTVVVCTRDRPTELARALDSLERQSYRNFCVLVVDNAPQTDATRRIVDSRAAQDLRYVREAQPGLSNARNRALEHTATPVVAWLDDDEIADRHWLMAIAGAFCTVPDAAAVSGAVVPAELRTQAQLWFEQYGGHSKGRGFRSAVFTGRRPGGQSALYPLPPFGVGANMAFKTEWLRRLGGFDPALGAGTITAGGEDTLVFTQLLWRGGSIVYQPSALTHHYHRPDRSGLERQMRGYGVGLTAFYTSLLRWDPRLALPILRLAPRALAEAFRRDSGNVAPLPTDYPRELLRMKAAGMLYGPIAYARARRLMRNAAGKR